MSDKNYICPRCNSEMYWTGNIRQDIKEKRWCKILYQYRCNDPRCRYESNYDNLDSSGIRIKHMIDNMNSILEDF